LAQTPLARLPVLNEAPTNTNTNRQYAQFVNEKMGQRFFRFVNGNDLIPRLPLGIPSWYFFS
jgi:hypothetical protein